MSVFSLLFLGLQFILLPALSFQTREILEEETIPPPKKSLYLQSIIMLIGIGVLGALVDWREDLEITWLGPVTTKVLVIGASIWLGGLLINILHAKFSTGSEEVDKSEKLLFPINAEEYMYWLLLCFTAAWSEEYIYRGVLPSLLTKYGMLPILAAVLSAVGFAFSHFAQGWIAIPVVFVFALAFQYLFYSGGFLLAPIIIHFVYNISTELLKNKMNKQ